MRPEKQSLIHDVFENGETDARRQAILVAGGRILLHKRRWRFARRCFAVAAVAGLMVLGIQRIPERLGESQHSSVLTNAGTFAAAPAHAPVHHLSDDELLDLFPDTPVALATIEGKKRLIFPRPGDEARFVSRLPAPPNSP